MLDLTDDEWTLVQVMVWCRQATSHYMRQCWPNSSPPTPQYAPVGHNELNRSGRLWLKIHYKMVESFQLYWVAYTLTVPDDKWDNKEEHRQKYPSPHFIERILVTEKHRQSVLCSWLLVIGTDEYSYVFRLSSDTPIGLGRRSRNCQS